MGKPPVVGPGRRGRIAGWLLVATLLVAATAAVWLLVRRGTQREAVVTSSAAASGSPGGVRAESRRAAPKKAARGVTAPGGDILDTTGAFEGCPAAGDGGDRALNRKKNRDVVGRWRPTALDSILTFAWPSAVGGRRRSGWAASATRQVEALEERAVRVEGYVVLARLSGPESTNCHGEDARYRDYHVWLTVDPALGRERSVIAEMTPRLRARHPSWNLSRLSELRRARERVRVDGWLLLDQEHPEQLAKTRGTLWEIHPVMAVAVWRAGRWIPLDSLNERGGRR